MSLQTIEFDLQITPGSIPPVLHMSQYDSGRQYTAYLKDETNTAFIPGTGATAKLKGFNAAGVPWELAATVDGSTVVFTPSGAATDQFGVMPVTIEIAVGGEKLTPLLMIFNIQRAGYTNEEAVRSPEFETAMEAAAAEALAEVGVLLAEDQATKTAAMTQPVGVDANGKLWTTPGGGGVSDEVKEALLACFEHVAWVDGQGQTYYDRLYNALYPSASIVSISAAFDQGTSIIYTDDSLDTLRQYLTVTATYDDTSIEVVDSYVLTGTLIAGVSTIRVLYSGLQTTFQCNVTQQILPPGYTRLDYVRVINSTAAPVYVLTGIVPDGGTSATYKFAINSVSAAGHLASCNNYYLPFFRSGKLFANRLGNEYDSAFSGLAANTPYTINAYMSGNEISVDGETATSLSIGTKTSNAITLFTFNQQTTESLLFIGRLYFMKIYQNGTLVRDYIPCTNDNNVVGFYDAVEQNFVTSATQNPLYPPE